MVKPLLYVDDKCFTKKDRLIMFEFSFVMSTIALVLYSISYFFNTKKSYLVVQLTGNVFLSVSYLLLGSYFTMVSVVIGIARGIICYTYEKKDKDVPIYAIIGLCSVTILCYFVINHIFLSQSSVWDVIYLFASCMYTVSFAIRNIRVMRCVVTIPHTAAIVYNLLIKAPISSAISYAIELGVTVVAIIKHEIQIRKMGR